MKTVIFLLLLTSIGFSQNIKLDKTFNLAEERSPETQYFHMQSHYIKYSQDGDRSNQEFYNIVLSCERGTEGEYYTCHQFTFELNGHEQSIPTLKGWTYLYNPGEDGLDEHGQTLGIPHDKFENLVSNDGTPIDQEHSYAVYNCFIDFHAFNNIYSKSMKEENGIDDLHNIGDTIIHAAANTEPPVHLGSNVMEGSVFRNGKVTMQFKGLGRIEDKTCALVGFDSGESSFTMKIEAMPGMVVDTNGSSHYFGDLYIDLDSYWLLKAEMAEFVVSETKIPSMDMTVPGIIERQVTIKNISEDEMDKKSGK